MAYIFQGLKELPSIHSTHVKVTTPDKVYEGDYVFGSISNATSVAAIVKLKSDIVDLCDGEFEVDKKDENTHWVGSTNQRVIDVQKTLAEGNIVLYED